METPGPPTEPILSEEVAYTGSFSERDHTFLPRMLTKPRTVCFYQPMVL